MEIWWRSMFDPPGGNMTTSVVERHREELEALAERDDLRCSKYAELLLEIEEERGDDEQR